MPPKAKKAVKRSADSDSSDESTKKPSKSAKKPSDKASANSPVSLDSIDFSSSATSKTGTKWNLKISSWNVNGIRAWLDKQGLRYLELEKPDIFCVQETKCDAAKLPASVKNVPGYHCYWLEGDKAGYSGVGLMSKEKPMNISYGLGIEKHDNEGRVITAEYSKFYLVNSYVPNAGRGLTRLGYRQEWNTDFENYLKELDDKKPVILCGDLNVAHKEIDLANPKTNQKTAGFTPQERDGFSHLLSRGFLDSFRELHPDEKGAYSFWTYMSNARAKNVGWRLDYFVISQRLENHLCESLIRQDIYGSDHCPLTLLMHL